eukprot:TRINITY_DN1399_c0_g2_i4.p1 TRINITY_DN1399_c0_g2~~TRINITY_DN1399_c0_g2_i4.p1  ORF type:complete len:126 (+),score=2.47 TRINITY_DN1399_c0_g2_i4:100-477(+)
MPESAGRKRGQLRERARERGEIIDSYYIWLWCHRALKARKYLHGNNTIPPYHSRHRPPWHRRYRETNQRQKIRPSVLAADTEWTCCGRREVWQQTRVCQGGQASTHTAASTLGIHICANSTTGQL